MPSNVYLPHDLHYHEDLEAERADECYRLALTRITVSDVLSEVDHLIAEEPDTRKHPLYHLARHVLRHGGFRRSGQRAHMADHLGMVFEDLIEEAIERLVQEELSHFGPWVNGIVPGQRCVCRALGA
jgi:hypothetical protein